MYLNHNFFLMIFDYGDFVENFSDKIINFKSSFYNLLHVYNLDFFFFNIKKLNVLTDFYFYFII